MRPRPSATRPRPSAMRPRPKWINNINAQLDDRHSKLLMPGGNTGMAGHGFPIFFPALSTFGLVNDVAILGFHDN